MIPSWYPTTANPLTGIFFQEQAILLQQRYEVRVLFGIDHPMRYTSVLRTLRWFPGCSHARVKLARADLCPVAPPVTAFEYAYLQMGEHVWMETAVEAYRQMLGRLINESWKPDIIHAHCAEFAGIITHRLALEFNIPWVLKENQVFVLSMYSEYRKRLMVDAMRAATTVVPVSQHQMRSILLHGIYRPMVVVGNPIDEDAFRFAEPIRNRNHFHILTVTYPLPIKDCETFFAAIAILLERGHHDIMVTVIGNKSFSDISKADTIEFEELASKYRVSQVCRFIASAPRSEMPEHYAECDVFVSTSIAETFGVAVREAMAVGRPVVCTASGGVEDDLSAINGIRVNIRDPEAVADALISVKIGRLVFDPAKIRESVVAAHGRQAYLAKMSSVYEDTMAKGHG